MYELTLTIDGQDYTFKADFGFMRMINAMVKTPIDSIDKMENIGMSYCFAKLIAHDVEALEEVLIALNKNQKPILKRSDLEEYLITCEDIDALFDEVIDFLSKANVSKSVMKNLQAAENK